MIPAVLVRKSTKQIIKEDLYPREDMQPVQGMDPDYEWLIKNIPYAEPPYDSRIYLMATNIPDLEFLNDFLPHPSYPGLREYRITFSPEKRPNDDIIRSIENAEKEANNFVFSEAVHKDEFAFMLSSVRKESNNLDLTEEEQAQISKLESVTVNLAKNKDNAAIKIAQVLSGQEPNIDSGWERSI